MYTAHLSKKKIKFQNWSIHQLDDKMGSNNSKVENETKRVDTKIFEEWIKTCGDNNIKKAEEMIEEGKHKYYEYDENTASPLHICVFSPEITKMLLKSGIPVNLPTSTVQSTPLHFAAFHDVESTTKILIENGGDVLNIDNEGLHPYLLARERNSYQSMFHLRKEMIRLGKGDFVNTWKQVCRPELKALEENLDSEDQQVKENLIGNLEDCVSLSFCLDERKLLQFSKVSRKESEEKYFECLKKNDIKL
jgi:ankyrin repeat protein